MSLNCTLSINWNVYIFKDMEENAVDGILNDKTIMPRLWNSLHRVEGVGSVRVSARVSVCQPQTGKSGSTGGVRWDGR